MELIEPSVEIWEPLITTEEEIIPNMYKHIEKAGRICYKSEPKEDSAYEFVGRLIKSGHYSVLEHGTVSLKVNKATHPNEWHSMYDFYISNPYSLVGATREYLQVFTNFRVIKENHREGDLNFITFPVERYTMHITCSRAIANEFVRHRKFSFSQESTRYCNYSKDRFNNQLTYIKPEWYDSVSTTDTQDPLYKRKILFDEMCGISERDYLQFIESGGVPQDARDLLPLCLKTELVMTGYLGDWDHFLQLRCASSAHPEARKLAIKIQTLLNEHLHN